MSSHNKQTILAGVETPRIGLGCMGMSEFYGPCDESVALHALHKAYELGYRHFDTADMYGNGHNEALLGRFLRELGGRRNDVLVATKVGIKRVDEPKPGMAVDSSPLYIRNACEESLRRLGVDQIGLLYLHRRSPSTPIAEFIGAMTDLVRDGKIAHIGLCEVSKATLESACELAQITALQAEYSLWTRDVEEGILDACSQHGVSFVAYSPLGRGFLTGEAPAERSSDDLRSYLPRFQPGNFEANLALLEVLHMLAGRNSCHPAQVALAWVMSAGPNVHAIPGSTKLPHLEMNMDATELRLTVEEMQLLASAFKRESVHGDRYPAEWMTSVNV